MVRPKVTKGPKGKGKAARQASPAQEAMLESPGPARGRSRRQAAGGRLAPQSERPSPLPFQGFPEEDIIDLNVPTDEEAALLSELEDLQTIRSQQKQQESQVARQERCSQLRKKIQDLKGEVTAASTRASPAQLPAQPTPGPAPTPSGSAAPWEDWTPGPSSQQDGPTGNHPGVPLAPRPLRSGLLARSTDRVRFPQVWPHVALQGDEDLQGLAFSDLDFRLLVAGELERVTEPGVSEDERQGRLRLLKQLTYLNGHHQWDIVKKVFSAVLRKIELGILHWGSCFLNDIQWILSKHTITHHTRTHQPKHQAQPAIRNPNTPIYCLQFNRGQCQHDQAHQGTYNGKQVWLQHICSKCLRKNGTTHRHSARDCAV